MMAESQIPATFADIVLKLNETGTKFNKRLLCVKDELVFYSHSIPAKFQPGNMDSIKGNPKAGVPIEDVIKIYGHIYHKINCFSIEFPKDKLLRFKSPKPSILSPGNVNSSMNFMSSSEIPGISNSKILEKKKNEGTKIIKWVFSTKCCENSEKSLDFWLKLLYKAKITAVQNRLTSEPSLENTNFGENSAMIVNKKNVMDLTEDNVKEPVGSQLEPIEKLKTLPEKKEEKEEKKDISPKRQLRLKKLLTKLQNDTEFAWDAKYYVYLDDFLKNQESPDDTHMKIFDLLGEFKRVSIEISIEIIEELLATPRFLHKNKSDDWVFDVDKEEALYQLKEKNLRVRISSIKNSKKIKAFGHEFRSMRVLQEHLINMRRKKPDFIYFLPLACKITYKGFVVFVTSTPFLENLEKTSDNISLQGESFIKTPEISPRSPKKSTRIHGLSQKSFDSKEKSGKNIDSSFESTGKQEKIKDSPEKALVLGPTVEGHYVFDRKVYEDTVLIAKSLNLINHNYRWSVKEDSLPVGLSLTLRVYKGNSDYLHRLAQYQEMQNPEDLRILWDRLASNKKIEDFNHFFIGNVADIFPLQISPVNPGVINEQQRFRPEFVVNYVKSMSSDVFLHALNDEESENLDFEAFMACEHLIKKTVPKLIEDISVYKENCPISSQNLTDSMHKHGLNIRFLGEIARKAKGTLAFLWKMAEREMIARSLKDVFRERIGNVIEKFMNKNNFQEKNIIYLENPEKGFFGKSVSIEIEDILRNETVGFFNLVFGKGRENEVFWQEIVRKKLLKKFDYFLQIDNFENFQGMYDVLRGHLHLKIKEKNVDFFEESSPFDRTDFEGWNLHYEGYELRELKHIYANDSFFILETEKRLGEFIYVKPAFCRIIENFLEKGELKKAKEELVYALKGKVIERLNFVNLLYLNIRVLLREGKNLGEIYEIIAKILAIFDKNLTEDHLIYPIFYRLLAENFYIERHFENALLLWKSSLLFYFRVSIKKGGVIADIHRKIARVHEENGDYRQEAMNLEIALDSYETEKFEHKRELYEVAWRLCKISKTKMEKVRFGLNCIEVLETEAMLYCEELIECYVLVIQETVELKDYKTGKLMVDNCANFLGKLEEIKYNTFKKLIDFCLECCLSEINFEKSEFFKEILKKMQEFIKNELISYQNDKKYIEMTALHALNWIIEENKLFPRISLLLTHHIECLSKFSNEIKEEFFWQQYRKNFNILIQDELRQSLIFLENLIILNLKILVSK